MKKIFFKNNHSLKRISNNKYYTIKLNRSVKTMLDNYLLYNIPVPTKQEEFDKEITSMVNTVFDKIERETNHYKKTVKCTKLYKNPKFYHRKIIK